MKKILSFLLALILVFSLFSMCGISTSAAEAGTLVSNAITLSDNVWHTKYWTSNNYRLNCYNKIVVPSRGYITFTAQKPFDDEGELCSYDFILALSCELRAVSMARSSELTVQGKFNTIN